MNANNSVIGEDKVPTEVEHTCVNLFLDAYKPRNKKFTHHHSLRHFMLPVQVCERLSYIFPDRCIDEFMKIIAGIGFII